MDTVPFGDNMIEAICFDMDGTLIDTEVIWVACVRQALEERNASMTHDETLNLVYGSAWRDIYAVLTKRFPHIKESREELSAIIQQYFVNKRNTTDICIHSSIGVLKDMAERFPVCIVTGSEQGFVEYGIEVMGISDDIQFYVSGDQYSPGKPDPVCYRMAAEKFGVAPENCLAFEDSNVGVRSAKGAGMHCIALKREGRPGQDVSMADMIVDDLTRFDLDEYVDGFRLALA